jgi:CDGSH-type Zn-finger protein
MTIDSELTQPTVADRKPKAVALEAGQDYHWCACGRSRNQPFCDGSHRTTAFKPLAFTAEENGEVNLCMCKRTGNAPYCDGSHARLGSEEGDVPPPVGSGDRPPEAVPTPEEPTLKYIHDLARDGLSKTGHHGEMGAMGVPRAALPQWDDIQILAAQLATKPLMDDTAVGTELVIGPNAKKPLHLRFPFLCPI